MRAKKRKEASQATRIKRIRVKGRNRERQRNSEKD